jgi:hypothetical protein
MTLFERGYAVIKVLKSALSTIFALVCIIGFVWLLKKESEDLAYSWLVFCGIIWLISSAFFIRPLIDKLTHKWDREVQDHWDDAIELAATIADEKLTALVEEEKLLSRSEDVGVRSADWRDEWNENLARTVADRIRTLRGSRLERRNET